MPSAARLNDMHNCPLVNANGVPHAGGPVFGPCANTVLIGGLPAAVLGDNLQCNGPVDSIINGSGTVLFEGKPAARAGDNTAHGGTIVTGLPTVEIGG